MDNYYRLVSGGIGGVCQRDIPRELDAMLANPLVPAPRLLLEFLGPVGLGVPLDY